MKIILTVLLLSMSLYAKTINIAVSANASYVIEDLKKEFFKLYPNIKLNIILGSSGKLSTQIMHHAPYDLFLSADMHFPTLLYKNSYAISKPYLYAKGSLALFTTKGFDLTKELNVLKSTKIKKIAIANPKTAPYGKATIEALKNANIYNLIADKLVFAESISQTIAYTTLATDVGIVATSSLFSSKMKKYKNYKKIDPKLYSPIKQGIVLIKDSVEAKQFYDFILSKEAKEIFKKYGYD